MKKINVKMLFASLLLGASMSFTSCKDKTDTKNTNTVTPTQAQDASDTTNHSVPVEISGDEALKTSVADATKDHPGVRAEVNNGEITLTGEIKRDNLQNLMMSLNTLKAKKINNNLTIK